MKVMRTLASLCFSIPLMLAAGPVLAHQPVAVDSETTAVVNPEISKAYFGKLLGEPHTYTITSDVEFNLYVQILVPDNGSPKRDVKAEIFSGIELLQSIGGVDAEWVTLYEPYGQNTYWDGGAHRARAQAGVYTIKVSSPDNESTYSLAVGEIESFDLEAIAKALAVMPDIQREFFNAPAIEQVGTTFGLIVLVVVYSAALVAGLLYRLLLRRTLIRLIGAPSLWLGRRFRVAAAFGLLGLAVTTSWSPILLFVSGFILFDVVFSWFKIAEPQWSERSSLR